MPGDVKQVKWHIFGAIDPRKYCDGPLDFLLFLYFVGLGVDRPVGHCSLTLYSVVIFSSAHGFLHVAGDTAVNALHRFDFGNNSLVRSCRHLRPSIYLF